MIERCDFCGSTELTSVKTFACEPFDQTIGGRPIHYVEDWDACATCAGLIDHNDWDSLLERANKMLPTIIPGWECLPGGAKKAAADALRKTHREFRERRLKTN